MKRTHGMTTTATRARWCAVIAGLSLVLAPAVAAQGRPPDSLHFDSEEILIDVRGDVVEVTGTYHFRVPSGRSTAQPILYPYPQDPLLGMARTLRLELSLADDRWVPIAFEELPPRGVRWRLPAVASEHMTVRTVYRQAMRSTYARYIVTTTQTWGEPLRRANFEIRLPQGAKNPVFSHPFRPKGPSVRVWTYEAENFLPREDIVVRYVR
jgi:hypothetical protein